jgi:hypothetical protein
VRYRLGALLVVGGLVFATLGIQSAAAGGPTLTRFRIELSGTSDWQSVVLPNNFIGSHYVAAQSPGATVERGTSAITLKGVAGTALSTAVDVLVELWEPDASSYPVKLAKGKLGTAQVKIYRTNATSTQILSMSNTKTTGDYTVSAYIPRSQFVGEGYTMPRVDPRRLVLAFYYPWFQWGSFDSGPWYDEPTTAYDTNVASEIAKQLDQAKQYGIDGMIISWDEVGNHAQRFDTTMNLAHQRSMVVAPVIELMAYKTSTGFNVPSIVTSIKNALARASDTAFLRVQGRPVVFVYAAYQLGAEAWQSIVASVAGAGHDPFYIGEPAETSFGFNGSYFYSPNGYEYNEMVQRNGAYMRTLRYAAQVNPTVKQRLWTATVSPGQNMSYFSPVFPKHEDRQDGKRYDLTWSAALSTDPEWVLVTSWNEWFEATHIVPSEKFGWRALQQTAGWAAGFHNPSAWGGEAGGGGLLDLPPLPLKLGGPRT